MLKHGGSSIITPFLQKSDDKLEQLISLHDSYKQSLRDTRRLLLVCLMTHVLIVYLTTSLDTLLMWLLPELSWGLLVIFFPSKLYDIHCINQNCEILCLNCKLKIVTCYFTVVAFVLVLLLIRSSFWSNTYLTLLDSLIFLLLLRAAIKLTFLRSQIGDILKQLHSQQLYIVQEFKIIPSKEPFQSFEIQRESISSPALKLTENISNILKKHQSKKFLREPSRDYDSQLVIYSH